MNAMSKWIAAVVLQCVSVAHATIIEGTFSGTVTTASGTANGVGLSSLVGLPITGTFSYDSSALQLVFGGEGTAESLFTGNTASDPVVISDTVAGTTYSVSGTVTSQLNIDTNVDSAHPENYFELSAQNLPGGPIGPGDVAGEIIVPLINYEGEKFWSHDGDPASVSFSNQNSGGELGQDTFCNLEGQCSGYFNFSIESASAGPAPVPLPASAWLMLSAVGGLGAFACKKRRAA